MRSHRAIRSNTTRDNIVARHSIANFIATVCCLNVAGAILWALQDVSPGTAQLLKPAEEQRIIESLPQVPPRPQWRICARCAPVENDFSRLHVYG